MKLCSYHICVYTRVTDILKGICKVLGNPHVSFHLSSSSLSSPQSFHTLGIYAPTCGGPRWISGIFLPQSFPPYFILFLRQDLHEPGDHRVGLTSWPISHRYFCLLIRDCKYVLGFSGCVEDPNSDLEQLVLYWVTHLPRILVFTFLMRDEPITHSLNQLKGHYKN